MRAASVLERIQPGRMLYAPGAPRLLERNLLVYKHVWGIFISGFFEPVFYLLAVAVGLGQLVGDVQGPGGEPVEYAAFVAPAMLAASAMNGAIYESTMNIFFKLKYAKTYDAILATPVGPSDIAIGEIAWSQLRGLLYAATFLIVMVALGLMPSPLGLLALPGAVLIGFAFAAVGMACTTYMRSWQDFDLIQLAILPLFLFSATFFPLDVYPQAIRPLIQLSPLYHGVALLRAVNLGQLSWWMLAHVGVLVILVAVGLVVAARRIGTLLLR